MQSEKEKVALTSIAISAGLTVAKAVVGWIQPTTLTADRGGRT